MIVTVLKTGGDFRLEHVYKLAESVNGDFVCLTDCQQLQAESFIETIPLTGNYPGWWSKMEALRPDLDLGDLLLLDLDTVALPGVVFDEYANEGELTVLNDMLGGPHMNSGMMYITDDDKQAPWEKWEADCQNIMQSFPNGDQHFLAQFWDAASRWQDKYPGEIISYKGDYLKRGFEGGEKIVCFHGRPRPWDVEEEWLI